MIRCPHCHKLIITNEHDEKELKRIERKKKREQKELHAEYMKDIRNGNTTLEFDEWLEYKSKEQSK